MGLGGYLWGSNKKKKDSLFVVERADGYVGGSSLLSMKAVSPPPPRTPQEPMEYLSRPSWSLSAAEISKALAGMNVDDVDAVVGSPESTGSSHTSLSDALSFSTPIHFRPCSHLESTPVNRPPASRWLPSWELRKSGMGKKEKERVERACVHAALSMAGVAAAIAAVSASGTITSKDKDSKMEKAMASATQLLASHFLEVAERSGVGHDKVAIAVRSALDIRTAGDLLTLTAAAATALRAASALRNRLRRELPWKMSAVFPCDRTHYSAAPNAFCKQGVLLKWTRKGQLEPKHVTVFIDNKSQMVILKLKSKHARGPFSKKKTCVVYGVCDEVEAWPGRLGGREKACFGIRTAQGMMEFECEDMAQKIKWVDGIRNLLDHAGKFSRRDHVKNPLQLKIKL